MPKNVIKEKEDFQRYILDYLKNKKIIDNANNGNSGKSYCRFLTKKSRKIRKKLAAKGCIFSFFGV